MSARLEPADVVLEELTGRLVDMTGDGPTCDAVFLRTRGEWAAELSGETSWATVVIEGPLGAELDDFQLAIIYGLGFAKDEDTREPTFFHEWELEQGDSWEEQTLRELALETIAILSRVLDCGPVENMQVDVSPI